MAWTTAERYRPYSDYSDEEKQEIKALAQQSPWRSTFHIEPETGLLNDPNGFSFFNGKWHLFYQHFPFGAVHGLKSWVHLTSDDLVHFDETGLVLYPDTQFDNAGAYSGSALPFEDYLFLIYTGNHRDENWQRIPYQIGAILNKDNQLTKLEKPVIEPDFTQTTDHFRDPQIFLYKNEIYVIIGGQNMEKKGIIKLYKADNDSLISWTDLGLLEFSNDPMGYMIECPNLVFVDGKAVLIFCPQGLDQSILSYGNIYPNLFVIADSLEIGNDNRLTETSGFQNLDDGFDCYATQAFNAPDGTAYAISWLGLPDTEYASDKFGLQGALSMVKKLTVKDGKLYQYPVDAMLEMRKNERHLLINEDCTAIGDAFELEIDFSKTPSANLSLLTDREGHSSLEIKVDKENHSITLVRGYEKRLTHVKIEKMNVFIDSSIFEIFVNTGEKVLSGRVFPEENQCFISADKGIKMKVWDLKE
ncbi:sucrose-6-phosphate hydrolase [Lactococcus sp.]|uniref:sucrose-6-phosphate hydrolase n=1 Tax=Lactococcus sp. TaxID=44273 RepID=UPI0035AF11D4